MNNNLLTEKSPVIAQPESLLIKLRQHQAAMLYRCIRIEKQSKSIPFGILADLPGSGKTAVILSLILAEKQMFKKTQNLIVVPSNIHTQWLNEIKKCAGDSLVVKNFVDYSEITSLYHIEIDQDFKESMENTDIFITTINHYENVIRALEGAKFNMRRIIFDEIDTVSNFLSKIEDNYRLHVIKAKDCIIENKITWFISATFDNLIDTEKGFKFNNKTISIDSLPEITCKCSPEFVKKSNFLLEEPVVTKYTTNSLSDKYFDCLSINQLDNFNSLNYQDIRGPKSRGKDELSSMLCIIEECENMITTTEEGIIDLSPRKYHKMIAESIAQLQLDLIFHKKVLSKFHEVSCNSNCEKVGECIKNKIKSSILEKTKIDKLKEILDTLKSTDKMLIFSDFSGSFDYILDIMDSKNIKYSELNGGNTKSIDKAIDNYKFKDTQVLLINSTTEGCGMNLENSTRILFLHKTADILYSQIVGRAQRPIRTTTLQIEILLNANEIV